MTLGKPSFKKSAVFFNTRPKPPFGRQGLAGYWGKDRGNAGTGPQLTSFGAKKSHHVQGDPTDLLWCIKLYVTDVDWGGPIDLLWCKKIMSLTWGSN